MSSAVRAFEVPWDLGEDTGHALHQTTAGTVVSHLNQHGSSRQRVLVCLPTLVFVRSGTKRLELGPQHQIITAGHLILLSRGLHIMTEILDTEAPYQSTLLSLDESFLRTFASRYEPRRRDPNRGSDVSIGGPQASPVIAPTGYLLELLTALPDQLQRAPDPRLIGLKVEEVMLAMRDRWAQSFWDRAIDDANASGDARFRLLIERHCLTPVSNQELATLTSRSLSTFKRDFTRIYGTSPARWLLKRRLDNAATLLAGNVCNVTEACWQSGFADVSSFIRAFKRVYRTTPKQYQLAHGSSAR